MSDHVPKLSQSASLLPPMLSRLSHRFVELSVQISFVQFSAVVCLFCSAVDGEIWNVRRRHSVEQELDHEDCSWVIGGGRKLAVELDPLAINHRRTAESRTREVRRRAYTYTAGLVDTR